jgi:predicted nucleic acid-binding protein
MKRYLFDTNVYSLVFSENIPEKWVRYWKEVRSGRKRLIIFEMLISEIFYKNSYYGFKTVRERLEGIKYLPTLEITKITDTDAFQAAEYMVSLHRFGLSLVDSYILTIAQRNRARIITTDGGIKKSGKKIGLDIDYLPFKSIKRSN